MHYLLHSLTHSAAMRRAGLPLALATLAACDDARRPENPTGPMPAPSFTRGGNGDNNGRIVFESNAVNDDYDVYSMNPDGTGVTRLTYATGFDGHASLSPDGKRIVFDSQRDDPRGEIYVMNADGTGVTRLTYSQGIDLSPAWSKDGKRIAFASSRDAADPGTQDFDIYVMNADGTAATRLAAPGADELPSWSADGKQIAFTSDRAKAGAFDVYTMNADGTQVTRITYFEADEPMVVSWSPGGKQLAFSTRQVFVSNTHGTQLTQLTSAPPVDADFAPAWSVDAKQIAFVRRRDGKYEIYTMNVDGTAVTRLTNNSALEGHPAWGR